MAKKVENKRAVTHLQLGKKENSHQIKANTTKELNYQEICHRRYENSRKIYDEQFLYELKKQEAMQPSAYDAMRFHRHFVITTLWPPLHTRKEIEMVLDKMKLHKLTEKQETRLRLLLAGPVN